MTHQRGIFVPLRALFLVYTKVINVDFYPNRPISIYFKKGKTIFSTNKTKLIKR